MIALMAGLLLLAGCQSRAERYPLAEDYCREEQRRIPDIEKMAAILTRTYLRSHTPRYIADEIAANVSPAETESEVREFIVGYIRKNPLCCQILEPDHLGNMIFNNEYYVDDYYSNIHDWGYIGDLFVFTRPPSTANHYRIDRFFDHDDLDNGFVLMVNNCAQTKAFSRG